MNHGGAARSLLALGLALVLGACERQGAPAAATPASAGPDSTPAIAKPSATTPAPSQAPVLAPATDYILPGALASDTGLEQLRQLFGPANVRIDERLLDDEGEPFRGVVLFADDPGRRAQVHFSDPAQLRGLYYVSVREAGSRWRLDNGLRVGMSLAELVRLNGGPIRFSGFGWDYGGTVTAWNGGRLEHRDGDPVVRGARLGEKPGLGAATAQAIPSDDAEYASDDPGYPGLGERLRVEELTVSFAAEDDL